MLIALYCLKGAAPIADRIDSFFRSLNLTKDRIFSPEMSKEVQADTLENLLSNCPSGIPIEDKLEECARLVDQYQRTLFQDYIDQFDKAQVINALVIFSEYQFHDLISRMTPDMKFHEQRDLNKNYLGG